LAPRKHIIGGTAPLSVDSRQRRILDELQARGSCTYREFEKLLGVSSMTVRRDVDVLAKRDALIKTLGGAQYSNVPQFLYETALSERIAVNRAEKDIIADSALKLVQPQQTLYLDGSSTCIALARLLAKAQFALTVITNSAIIAMEVGVSPTAKVLCLGGDYDPQSASFVGVLAEEACVKFFVDTAFMSTKAFLPEEGMFESSIAALRIKQLMAQRSAKLVLLVDHSKFGQRSLCRVVAIEAIHTVVTDAKSPRAALEVLRKGGRQVVVAGGSEPEEPKAA
jgi:DeoR/GlpR family transcriptional regulator of sugar metabolism